MSKQQEKYQPPKRISTIPLYKLNCLHCQKRFTRRFHIEFIRTAVCNENCKDPTSGSRHNAINEKLFLSQLKSALRAGLSSDKQTALTF